MKRLAIFLLLSISAFAANGDILAVRIAGDTQRSDASHCTTNGTTTVVCSGGLFTQNDANQKSPIEIPGAGTAAGDFLSTITAFTNATTVTVGATPATNVANVTGQFGTTHNGWVAEIDIATDGTHPGVGGVYSTGLSAANDPTSAKAVFTVTSQGYNTSGVLGTNSRTVYCTQPMRQPYPNHTTNDEYVVSTTLTIKCILSQYIHQSDTATVTIASGFYTQNATSNNAVTNLAVTNNSTVAYPHAIARWAWPGNEAITGNTFLLEAVGFDQYYHSKAPLAAVVFTITDQHSITVSQTVTAMTISTRGVDTIGNPVPVYAALMDTSTLTQGDTYTANFKAYPWVGDATSIQDSSLGSQNTENLGPLGGIVDRTGAYGQAHAYVASGGTDPGTINQANCTATNLIKTTEAAAEATTGFASIGAAIRCAVLSGVARTNANDNVFIWVNASGLNFNTNVPGSDLGAQDTWINVSVSNGGTCNLITGTLVYNMRAVKVSGCNFSGSATIFQGGNAGSTLWFDNDTITSTAATLFYKQQVFWATRTTSAAGTNATLYQHQSTNRLAAFLRGVVANSIVGADCYVCLGSKGVTGRFLDSTIIPTGQSLPNNVIDAFNTRLNYNSTGQSAFSYCSGVANATAVSDIAIVSNLFEKSAGTTPAVLFSGDGTNCPTSNIIEWHNTFIGERNNGPYNDGGGGNCSLGPAHTLWNKVGNIYSNDNDKADTFLQASCTAAVNQQDGMRTGGWPVRMGVNRIGDAPVTRTITSTCDVSNDYSIGVTGFQPEFSGIYGLSMASAPTLGFVADRGCGTGTGSGLAPGISGGNGDYHLTPTSGFAGIIPCSLSPLPFDLDGNARCSLTNTTAVGAYAATQEFQSTSVNARGTAKVRGAATVR